MGSTPTSGTSSFVLTMGTLRATEDPEPVFDSGPLLAGRTLATAGILNMAVCLSVARAPSVRSIGMHLPAQVAVNEER